jgi:hypothetical protein
MWFWMTITMSLSFLVLAFVGIRELPFWRWFTKTATLLAVGLFAWTVPSGIRAGYVWYLLHCQNQQRDCDHIIESSWLMLVAPALAIVAGMFLLRLLFPWHWRPWSWMIPGSVSFFVPLGFYYYDTLLPGSGVFP